MSRSAAQSPLVIDASALVELLIQSEQGALVERAIGDAELFAPDVVNPEVMQSLRGLERGGKLTSERASQALTQFAESGISRIPTGALMQQACPCVPTSRPTTHAMSPWRAN
jgi:predicted nucleic acid-binding protein